MKTSGTKQLNRAKRPPPPSPPDLQSSISKQHLAPKKAWRCHALANASLLMASASASSNFVRVPAHAAQFPGDKYLISFGTDLPIRASMLCARPDNIEDVPQLLSALPGWRLYCLSKKPVQEHRRMLQMCQTLQELRSVLPVPAHRFFDAFSKKD